MLADVLWKIVPMSDLGHQPLKTIRPSWSPRRFASSGSLALRKRSASSKKFLPFALLSLDSILDQFHQHPVGTKPTGLRHAANLRCNIYRKTDALAYCLIHSSVCTKMVRKS